MDQIGGAGNDMLAFQGNLQQLTITLFNPYSNQEIDVDEEKNVNFAKYYGNAGFDTIRMTAQGDALFLEDPDTGEQTVFDVEFIQAFDMGDVVNFASETIDYSQGIIINGGRGDDILWGNIGPDNISGADGNDNLDGGPGADFLNGQRDDDLIFGGAGNDQIFGDSTTPNANFVGDDTVHAGTGDDFVSGGFGNDLLNGDEGTDTVNGDQGNDTITGGAGNDTLNGGDGNDIIYGGTGENDSDFIDLTLTEHNFNEVLVFPTLIERKNIDRLDPPGTVNLGIVDGNLSVETRTTAKITFLESGAGYKNTLGFYNIAADGTIQHTEIAFENVHRSVATPGLEYTVELPGRPDTDFGFFIISDGFRRENGYNGLDLDTPSNLSFVYKYGTVDERLAKVTDDASDISLVYDDGSTVEILSGRGIYHTHTRGDTDLNLNPDGAEHVVSGLVEDGDTSTLRIGFEDLRNLGDADFNDVVFDLEIADVVEVTNVVDDNDIIDGGAGNDIIVAGYGNDIITGGTGADTFLYQDLTYSLDTITDFDTSEGDILNVTDLLEGYDDTTDAITDFIRFTEDNGDVVVAVDTDGGGDAFTDIVVVEGGFGGASVQDLIDTGNLVVDVSVFT